MLKILVFAGGVFVVSAGALTTPADLVESEWAQADAIVEGEVESQTPRANDEFHTQTQNMFRIDTVAQGAALSAGQKISILTPGGERQGLGVYFTGLPRPHLHGRYRVYLKSLESGHWKIQGNEHGLINLNPVRQSSRNRTDGSNGEGNGAFLHWSPDQFPIPFYISRRPLVGHPEFATAIRESFRPWREVEGVRVEFISQGCSENVRNANDGLNNVIFLSDRWPFDSTNVAITRNFYVADGGEKSGLILDSDILINGVNFQFTTSGEPGKYDLQNTLTHEVGHFLGLGHEITPADSDATMYATTVFNETGKRTLHANDIRGIFEGYAGPRNAQDFDGVTCEIADGTTGCLAIHRRTTSPGAWPLFLIWLLATVGAGKVLYSPRGRQN